MSDASLKVAQFVMDHGLCIFLVIFYLWKLQPLIARIEGALELLTYQCHALRQSTQKSTK